VVQELRIGSFDVAIMVESPWYQCPWIDFDHGHITPHRRRRQQAEALSKCPLTFNIANLSLLPRLHASTELATYG